MTLEEVKSLIKRKDSGLVPKFSFLFEGSPYEEIPLSLSGEFLNFIVNKEIIPVHFSEVELVEINKSNTPIRNIGLPILQEDPVQDCQRCNHVQKCWFASTNNITLNLLTCRIKYGIKENASLRHFFTMIKPKLQKITKQYTSVVWADSESYEENMAEMQAAVYDAIKSSYNISSVLYITAYLFSFPAGVVTRWARNKINSNLKYYSTHQLTDTFGTDSHDVWEIDTDDYIYAVFDIIEDGKTLTTDEYRILSFLMKNAREDRHRVRMMDGLIAHLENLTNMSKTDIRDNFKSAKEKLIEAIND
jgi:hypothetical protein